MLAVLRPWRLRSSGAHCDPELAKRICEKLGEEDWRDTWRRGLAKRIGEEDWQDTWRRGLARSLAKEKEEEEEKEKKENGSDKISGRWGKTFISSNHACHVLLHPRNNQHGHDLTAKPDGLGARTNHK